MTIAPSAVSRAPQPSSLADVLDLILDKGLVIDAYVRVSLVGIELLTIDARVVVASVDTYLRFAEATNRLDLRGTETQGLPGVMNELREGGAEHKTKGALEGVKEEVGSVFSRGRRGGDEDDDGHRPNGHRPRERVGAGRRSASDDDDGGRPRRRRPREE
jgi:hypothetical protein